MLPEGPGLNWKHHRLRRETLGLELEGLRLHFGNRGICCDDMKPTTQSIAGCANTEKMAWRIPAFDVAWEGVSNTNILSRHSKGTESKPASKNH